MSEVTVQPMALTFEGEEDQILLVKTKAAQVGTADGSDVETELGKRSLTGHKHTKSEITDFPASLKNPTALKVQLNGGTTEGTNQFTYDGSTAKTINITPAKVGAAAASHTHTKSQITDFPAIPTKLPNPQALTISLNGTAQTAYTGSTAVSFDITPASIGASAVGHTHTKSEITDFPSALKNPSSLAVSFNGGKTEGTDLFTYDGSAAKSINVTPGGIGAAAKSHTHTKSQITDFPASLKNPNALSVKLNGSDPYSYDGSAALELNITPAGIGAAAASHTHTRAQITDFPASLKNPTALTVQANGTTIATYDGSTAKTANLTYTNVGAAAAKHTHASADITSLDAAKLTGTIDIARLPKGSLERMYIADDDTARFKLTTAEVQNGDTVKVASTGVMYYVVDDTKLTEAAGYEVYTAGSATSVPWTGVTGKPSTFTPSSHTHTKAQITDFPASLKNPTSLTLKFNGGSTEGTNLFTYDGSAAKTANITPAGIGAAAASHTHTKSQITDFPAIPTKLPNPQALAISLNGGKTEGTDLFTYTGSAAKTFDITPAGIGAAAASHTHTKSQITDFPAALKNPNALTIQTNGTSQGAYDGSAAKTINITAANVGAAAASHKHTISQITDIANASVASAKAATTVAVPVGSIMLTLDAENTATFYATAFGGTWEVVGNLQATVGSTAVTIYMVKKTA